MVPVLYMYGFFSGVRGKRWYFERAGSLPGIPSPGDVIKFPDGVEFTVMLSKIYDGRWPADAPVLVRVAPRFGLAKLGADCSVAQAKMQRQELEELGWRLMPGSPDGPPLQDEDVDA